MQARAGAMSGTSLLPPWRAGMSWALSGLKAVSLRGFANLLSVPGASPPARTSVQPARRAGAARSGQLAHVPNVPPQVGIAPRRLSYA
jgi:hypothetical protein